MGFLDRIHTRVVHPRRVAVLARHLSRLIPAGASVLDVGCGDGQLAAAIGGGRADLSISGLDVLQRPHARVPVRLFDGLTIPALDRSVDVVMLVDVLHHTADPMVLLPEAARVARTRVLIKDHVRDGILAGITLRFMDRTGNARHGVSLPYNYWTSDEWQQAFDSLGLQIAERLTELRLYPIPARWLFDRSLHFIAALARTRP